MKQHEAVIIALEKLGGQAALANLYSETMITCDDDNIGYAKVIEGCSRIMQDKVMFQNELIRRY
jgi:predicted acetyltransferase